MRKAVIYLILVVVFCVFSAQEGYAFWGKKKKTKAKTEKSTLKEQTQEESKAKDVVRTEKKKAVKKQVKKEIKKKTPVKKAVKQKSQKDLEKIRALRQEKRQLLNNTSWMVEVSTMPAKGKKKKDTLVFESNRFYSGAYLDQGFNASNYTVSLTEDGRTVWETMQTAEDGKILFWRGEVSEDMSKMNGVFSLQIEKGKSESFSFISNEKRAIKTKD